MKANEFVKNFGIGYAKDLLHDARGCVSVKLWDKYDFTTDDLKRLVESHELVDSYGGLDMAKSVLDIEIHEPYYNYSAERVTRLSKAINDVESCQ